LKAYGWWVENNVPGRVLRAGVPLQRDLESRQDRAGLQAVYRASAPALRTDWAVEVGADRLHLREVRQTLHGLAGNLVNSSLNAASGAQRRIHYGTVELNTRLGESWSAVYGARLDDYSDFGSHRSPRAGLVFQPGAASAVKLLYGQAFRAPSAAERIGNVGTVLGNDSLRPEVITTLELLALRQTGRLLWQASVFRSIWRDGIAIVFRPELGINQYQNVERNRAHGASGSLTLQQGPWQLALGGAWITSRNAGSGARYSTFPRTMLNAVLARSVLEGAGRIELAQRWMADFDDIPRGDVFTPVALPTCPIPMHCRRGWPWLSWRATCSTATTGCLPRWVRWAGFRRSGAAWPCVPAGITEAFRRSGGSRTWRRQERARPRPPPRPG
jgi:iron complex outermembrane receptor protein